MICSHYHSMQILDTPDLQRPSRSPEPQNLLRRHRTRHLQNITVHVGPDLDQVKGSVTDSGSCGSAWVRSF